MFDLLKINKNTNSNTQQNMTGNTGNQNLKIVPLGAGDVTKNMFLYEFGNEILIIDCGIGFPKEEMFGIDLIIPDIGYLQKKLQEGKKIVGMILSHGHDDHIGALGYILPQIKEVNFGIYTNKLTKSFIDTQLKDFGLEYVITAVNPDEALKLGSFTINFVRMTHSVPEDLHLIIQTPLGILYHGTDYKFDWSPLDGVFPEVGKIAEAGNKGILLLASDCLNSQEAGYASSETDLIDTFEYEMSRSEGKFVFTTQSSNILRIKLVMQIALKYSRKLCLVGRSIVENMEDARKLGYLNDFPTGVYISEEKIGKYDPKNVCLIVAGSQGQVSSALSRMVSGEHKVHIEEGDTVLISGDPIPGNEKAVAYLIDSLSRIGAKVLHSGINDNLHVSGHAKREEMKLLLGLTRPKFLMPIGGTYTHMFEYRKLAATMGFVEEKTFLLDERQILETDGKTVWISKDKTDAKQILVDGLGVGDVGNVVLRDRKTLATDGMLVAVITMGQDRLTFSDVDIVTRGFIFAKENKEFIDSLKNEVVATVNENNLAVKDLPYFQKKIISRLEKYINRETQRRPLILVEMIEV
jgi:ribonuclease J